MLKGKQKKLLKSYRLNESICEKLESLQHIYGYVGERDASAFMNEFLEESLAEVEFEKGPLDKKARRKT